MAEIKKVAAVAAEWWTERIANPNANNFNNGDRTSLGSLFIMMNCFMHATDHTATSEQLGKFQKILAEDISEALDSRDNLFIDTDYGPCNILGNAAKKAGIDASIFPFKRMMWISANSVTARDGLDASNVTLYPTD